MMANYMLSIALLCIQSVSPFAQQVDYGPALTEAALKIQGAISPACNTTDSCVQFVADVIPRCQKLQGDAGCWCGNHNPLHFCAICMSNPTNNQTSPDQTATALEGHQNHHIACNAFEQALNTSSTTTSTAAPTSTVSVATEGENKKLPIGAIIGGAVGGVIAIAICILVLVPWLRSRNQRNDRLSNVSLFSVTGPSTRAQPWFGPENPQSRVRHHGQMGGQPQSMESRPNRMTSSALNTASGASDEKRKKRPDPKATGPYKPGG